MWSTQASGWFPKLSWPTVAHGNRGIFLSNVPAGTTQQYLNVDGYAHGWLSPDRLLCSEIVEPNGRFVFVLDRQTVSAVSTVPPWEDFAGLLEIRASLGHWAAWNTRGEILYDGRVIASGYHGVRQHGEYLAARSVNDNFELHVFYRGNIVRRIPRLVEVYDWAIVGEGPDAGTVVYGYPRVMLSRPSGAQNDITRGPGEGASGGGGMVLVNAAGVLWLWTAGQITPGTWGVIGGPVDDPAVMVLDMPAATLDVQHVGRQFHIAASDGMTPSTLRVDTVEDVAYRGPIEKPVVVVVPAPVPEPTPEPVPEPPPVVVPPPVPVYVPAKKWWQALAELIVKYLAARQRRGKA